MNPLIPFDKYLSDPEVHVFQNRVYVYGSQDEENGRRYCPLDYVCYSADSTNLADWKEEGVVYAKTLDPLNRDGRYDLYAPDVVEGNDGFYYLYYAFSSLDSIRIARSSSPKGPFSFYGEVCYPIGIQKEDLPEAPYSFDPAMINDNGHIYLLMGFSVSFEIEGLDIHSRNNRGAYIVELEEDMKTMKHPPKRIAPGYGYGKGTSFQDHEFLEAASIRKYDGIYYFIYSSQAQHELCYATSEDIYGPYTCRGVLVSNAFEGKLKNNWANNHGSILNIQEDYYIFYHRHTYGKQYSRQLCVEKLQKEGILFHPVRITSGGIEEVLCKGSYPAAIACFVYDREEGVFLTFSEDPLDAARIEGEKIVNIKESTVIFRYFAEVKRLKLSVSAEEFSGKVSLYSKNHFIQTKEIHREVTFDVDYKKAELELRFSSAFPLTLDSIEVL